MRVRTVVDTQAAVLAWGALLDAKEALDHLIYGPAGAGEQIGITTEDGHLVLDCLQACNVALLVLPSMLPSEESGHEIA